MQHASKDVDARVRRLALNGGAAQAAPQRRGVLAERLRGRGGRRARLEASLPVEARRIEEVSRQAVAQSGAVRKVTIVRKKRAGADDDEDEDDSDL